MESMKYKFIQLDLFSQIKQFCRRFIHHHNTKLFRLNINCEHNKENFLLTHKED